MSVCDLDSQWSTVPILTHLGSFEMYEIFTSDFGTVGMCRRFHACAYEFLTTVTEGVVHGVHKVVIRSSFGVIRQHKVS